MILKAHSYQPTAFQFRRQRKLPKPATPRPARSAGSTASATVSAPDANADGKPVEPYHYESEIRFGVVMYGGVSLAIYMNGVAHEMYEMVCATPKCEPGCKPEGTREIYHRIALLVNNPRLRTQYRQAIEKRDSPSANKAPRDIWNDVEKTFFKAESAPHKRVRFVVDAIAGTSAGGINGIFLAKALANGEPFAPLRDLWLDEGDIKELLNDKQSCDKLPACEPDNPPASLLNGKRMYYKLFQAMEKMSESAKDRNNGAGNPQVDEMDLYVTTTDINGSQVPLRLTDDVVYERRYKRSFHFNYSKDREWNDFGAENNALLAFAARCTSSFPFAFEPMTLEAAKGVLEAAKEGAKESAYRDKIAHLADARFFSYLPKEEVDCGKHAGRAFGDGGYLDNKPFSYVTNVLAIRQAFVPVERKLVYVEPNPELVSAEENSANEGQVPDAISNSLAALTGIPRYETIRENLQEVLERNRTIERVERIVQEGERDLHAMLGKSFDPYWRILNDDVSAEIPPFPKCLREQMAKYYGPAFLAYRRMRTSAVTAKLADRLAELWGADRESDHRYALRMWVRKWCDHLYDEESSKKTGNGSNSETKRKSINDFLTSFDVDYRIRRLSFLLRQMDKLMRVLQQLLDDKQENPDFVVKLEELQETDQWCIRQLGQWNLRLEEKPDADSMKAALAALKVLKLKLNNAQAEFRSFNYIVAKRVNDKKIIDHGLKNLLKDVLAVALDDRNVKPIELQTMNGGTVELKISEETRRACACSHSIRESVSIRLDALFEYAKANPELTKLQKALEDTLQSMSLAQFGMPTWNMLGKPKLRLLGDKLNLTVEEMRDPVSNTEAGKSARRALSEYYLYFDLFDQMSFPLYYGTEIGEPCMVEVARISPKDAKSLVEEEPGKPPKLEGKALFNFGGFLDRGWRCNDIMWGRLDGAERLIQLLLPMEDACTKIVRKELILQAQLAILRERYMPEGLGKVASMLAQALNGLPEGDTGKKAIHDSLEQFNIPEEQKQQPEPSPGTGVSGRSYKAIKQKIPLRSHASESGQHAQVLKMLTLLVDEQSLINYVKQREARHNKPDAAFTLDIASRAVTITGRVLEGIGKQSGKNSAMLRWLVRFGLMFQGLVAVSLPGSVLDQIRRHFMAMLYMFVALWVILAWITSSIPMQSFALSTLLVIGFLHVLTYLTHDVMGEKGWIRRLGILITVLFLMLSAAGVLALHHVSFHTLLHGEHLHGQATVSAPLKPSPLQDGHAC